MAVFVLCVLHLSSVGTRLRVCALSSNSPVPGSARRPQSCGRDHHQRGCGPAQSPCTAEGLKLVLSDGCKFPCLGGSRRLRSEFRHRELLTCRSLMGSVRFNSIDRAVYRAAIRADALKRGSAFDKHFIFSLSVHCDLPSWRSPSGHGGPSPRRESPACCWH